MFYYIDYESNCKAFESSGIKNLETTLVYSLPWALRKDANIDFNHFPDLHAARLANGGYNICVYRVFVDPTAAGELKQYNDFAIYTRRDGIPKEIILKVGTILFEDITNEIDKLNSFRDLLVYSKDEN